MNPQTETELKLHLSSPDARGRAEEEVANAPTRELLSVYYDTEDRRLRRAGWSLRVRRDGDLWTQTVKGPLGAHQSRFEAEAATEALKLDLDALRRTPAGDLVDRIEDVRPVFQTEVRRRSRVKTGTAAEIEISFDEGEVVTSDRRAPILELELELKSGSPAALFQDARRLAAAGPFALDLISKAERGYQLLEDADREARKFEPPKISGGEPAGRVFQKTARSALRQLTENAALFCAASRPEAVHQARVALRRLRVALGVFKAMFPKKTAAALGEEVVWLTCELAAARDLDVFAADRVHPALAAPLDREAFALFSDALRRARSAAYAACRTAFQSERYRLLVLDLAEFAEIAPWMDDSLTAGAAQETAETFGRAALDKRWRRVRKRDRTADWTDPSDVHKLRIAAKKLRYTADLFEPLARDLKAVETFNAELKALQDRLGALNDLRMAPSSAKTVLNEVGTREEALAAGLAAGVLISESDRLRTKSLKAARKHVARFLETPTWW